MYLAAIEDIRDNLGFDDMANINEAIGGALDAATPLLEGFIRTDFEEVTQTDTFYVGETTIRDGLISTTLQLKRGFVTAVASVVYANDIADFGTAAETAVTTHEVDLEAGLVKEFVTEFTRVFIRVTYTAGFTDDGTTYTLDEIPSWLQEAAKAHALIVLESHPALEDIGTTQDTNMLKEQFKSLIGRKVRYAPTASLPL